MTRWGGNLVALALLAASSDARADDHVVINVVNRLVYVSLGTRDGASVGDEIDVMAEGVVLGKIELDLCGEVICRGKLPNSLATKVLRGMSVRVSPAPAGPAPKGPALKGPAPTGPVPTDPVPTGPEPIQPKASQTKRALPIVKPATKQYTFADDDRPARMPYRTPIPLGYRVERQRISAAVTIGWIGLSVTYGISFLTGLNGRNDSALLLPVIGPFLHAATNNSSDSDAGYLLLGAGQVVSLVFLIAGYSGERVLVKQGAVSLNVGPSGFIGRF